MEVEHKDVTSKSIVKVRMIATANGNNCCSNSGAHKGDGNKYRFYLLRFVKETGSKISDKRVIHSIKVGIALVLVSLLFFVKSMFRQVGDNAMWAVMTVVVMFEFYAGATLGKGINRGVGTLLGGGLGCLAATIGDDIGGIAKHIIIAASLFLFSVAATYCRLVPKIKKKYDYGFMIFILTFNLVAVSGVRAEQVVQLARDRLAAVGMGFAVCVFVSLFICPIWASNELHYSTASKFDKLASSIQGCLDEYFKMASEKENQSPSEGAYVQACKSVLNSKSNDEPPPMQRESLKDPCENFMLSIQWLLKELGEGIEKMESYKTKVLLTPKLQSMKLQLSPRFSTSKMEVSETDEDLAIASFNFLLLEIVDKVEILAQKVQELGEVANFRVRKIDV
ncbi:hypothetical protein CDL12_01394 [Handroanthus impetiginosus]|uniref:Aluminum-activated malate transporter n=1 Tax=Handroanthus impetiginosus TaxID=429701 RepID=A0A2G9I7Z2_9LAMI|nr:hypothetical protein CDL12_01394 [Handroanthus impetiginosus]